MVDERRQLEAAITGLEAQRALLGDAVVEAALGPMRTKLATLAPAARALRQVSIVFMDAVNSTALARTLGPEDVADIIDGLLAAASAQVRAEGGRVMLYAGDCLVAAFGAAEAREDDAERAVRCGLALLDVARAHAAAIRDRHGWDGFGVRVGIHTGGVLLGGGVDGDATLRGDAVNIAARMEQTAPPGRLRISHATYRLVRGVFDVEPQPPIAVKGVAEPVGTYLVEGAKARAFRVATRGIEGVETRMIGRDGELEALQSAFLRLVTDQRLAAVSVVGEAGLGKSRLVYEFSNWAEARPERYVIFQGRATPRTPGQPYGLLRDILAWRFRLADGESMEEAKTKLEQGLIPLFEADGGEAAHAHAHLLGYLIGLDYADSPHVRGIRDDQRQIRNRAFHAAAEMFRRITAGRGIPAVMELEDLHWADDPSLDFLFYLGQVARDVPLLIVGLMRPTLFERRADWIGAADHRRLDLAPFGKGLSRELANELLKKLSEVPSALRELIGGGGEGNPFYTEELVKMLIDQRAIDTSGDAWTLDANRLLTAQVPPTLTGVLQARLDGLPACERRAMQAASVVGLVFWDQALAALDGEAPAALAPLERRELALPRPDAAFAGMREYTFKHQILHQVTYETVLKRARRDWHARAAAWFAALTDARAADFLGIAAQHFAAAGNAAAACEYFTRAAEHARARSANDAAMDMVEQALSLIESVTAGARARLQWRLLDARERTFEIQGRRDEQLADLDTLEGLADALDDDALRAEVGWRRAHRAMRMGDFAVTGRDARRAVASAARAGDAALRLKAERMVAIGTAMQGDMAAGQALAEAGLAEVRARGLRELEVTFLGTLSTLASFAGDYAGSMTLECETLQLAEALGDRRLEMMVRSNLAISWLRMGRAEDAHQSAEAAAHLARTLGDRVFEGVAFSNLSETAVLLGHDAQALAHAGAALAIAIETQARDKELDALLHLGAAELALGRNEAAADSFSRAIEIAQAVGQDWEDALAGAARAALALGDPDAALCHLEPVLAALASGEALDGADRPLLVRLTCWQALTAAGDPRAASVLEEAHRALQADAAAITDPALRLSFLENLPVHRAIIAAWKNSSRPAVRPGFAV